MCMRMYSGPKKGTRRPDKVTNKTSDSPLSRAISLPVCVSFLTLSKPHFPTPNLPVSKIIGDITGAKGEDFLSGVISIN